MTSILDIQKRLLSLGYKLPKFGADGFAGNETATALKEYQAREGLPITGQADAATLARLFPSDVKPVPSSPIIIPASWMPLVPMSGIVVHWTAGGHNPTTFDKGHYHILISGAGSVIRGAPTIDLNQNPIRRGYAAHTLNCNSGWIGVSLACMSGARESPFDPGSAPMTRAQWDKLPYVLAVLCERYSIAVTPKTVLSHAEVETNLGIKQKGKWDIARLAFDPSIKGEKACGDIFRSRTAALL